MEHHQEESGVETGGESSMTTGIAIGYGTVQLVHEDVVLNHVGTGGEVNHLQLIVKHCLTHIHEQHIYGFLSGREAVVEEADDGSNEPVTKASDEYKEVNCSLGKSILYYRNDSQ